MSECSVCEPALHVESSWKASNEKRVEDVVTTSYIDDYSSDEEGLTSMVSAERCVCLSKETSSEPCFITFKFQSPPASAVTRLVVVSEAKVIELYGALQEYLTTVTSEFLCEIDEMAVYCADIKFDHSTPECSLKFARTSKAFEVWLYGVRVIWESYPGGVEVNGLKSPFLSFAAVDERLKYCPTPLSNKAQKCKEFIKLYGSLAECQKFKPNPLDLIPLLSMAYKQVPSDLSHSNLPKGDTKRDELSESIKPNVGLHLLSDNLNILKAVPGSEMMTSNLGNSTPAHVDVHDCSKCIDSFRVLLDEKFQSLETHLLKVFDERFAALQQLQEKKVELLVEQIVREMCLPDIVLKATTSQFNQSSEASSVSRAKTIMSDYDFATKCSKRNIHDSPKVSNRNFKSLDANPEDQCSSVLRGETDGGNVSMSQSRLAPSPCHNSLVLDQNSNSVPNSVPVYPFDQIRNEDKPLETNHFDFKNMMSLLCSKVSSESKHHAGSIEDSVIEKAIMDTLDNLQSKTVI